MVHLRFKQDVDVPSHLNIMSSMTAVGTIVKVLLSEAPVRSCVLDTSAPGRKIVYSICT